MYCDKIIRVYVHDINGIDLYKRFMIISILFYIPNSSTIHDIALFYIQIDLFYMSDIKFAACLRDINRESNRMQET
jgi:hypothetical protein